MTDFDALASHIVNNKPIFHDRNRTPYNQLSNKKIEELRKQFKLNVENIKARHDWLEASRRKNYEMEYDRTRSELNVVLNKDPNAHSIQKLQDRMKTLKDMADLSVNGVKHEIYAKDSTGGHTTTTTINNTTINRPTTTSATERDTIHCDICNRDFSASYFPRHLTMNDHKNKAAAIAAREQRAAAESQSRLAESQARLREADTRLAEAQITLAERGFENDRLREQMRVDVTGTARRRTRSLI